MDIGSIAGWAWTITWVIAVLVVIVPLEFHLFKESTRGKPLAIGWAVILSVLTIRAMI